MERTMTNLSPLFRGDSREFSLTFSDDDGKPIDITGWKVYFTLKDSEGDPDSEAILRKDVTDHHDAEAGNTRIHLDPSDTNGVQPGEYHFDFQIKKPNGDILTVAKGEMRILTDITRRA